MSHAMIHAESDEKFPAAEERAGYALLDPLGEKIGSGEPEYVRVKMGSLKPKTALITVSFATVDARRRTLTLK